MADNQILGLKTTEALGLLHRDLEDVLKENNWAGGRDIWIKESFNPCSPLNTLTWPSVVVGLLSGFFLLLSTAFGAANAPNFLAGFTVVVLVCVGVGTALWDGKLRRIEVLNRVKNLIESIKRMEKYVNWTEDNYPNLASPTSPCITLQWAWRDGRVVNLPWALLVRGDVILLRPGQVVPGLCVPVEDKNGQTLHAREIFNPQMGRENLTLPAARVPLENKKYRLLETPYTRNIRVILEQALQRPVSFHDKERHLILTTCIEQTALPLVLVLVLVVNILRQFYLTDWFGNENWCDLLFVQPITAGLPLMPLVFPVVWRLLSAWGSTKLRAVLQDTTPAQIGYDPFEDADLETSSLQCNELWRFYKEDILGHGPLLCRSNNVVHVLGSVTALCCVDKKGVLSWPNPTAEKVFFLRSPDHQADCTSLNSEGYNSGKKVTEETNDLDPLNSDSDAVPEVLDLTHDHTSPFRLHFDDPSWKLHLSSLKPLGLAILLNTCNANSQDVYSQFCCHLTCEAVQNENLVPVTNRRCLCELAAQIGFLEQAQSLFNLEQMLCTFQHVKADIVKRDIKFARQLSKSTKLKFPFPHMVATVLRDKQTGCLQLMSQGTADVILDSCVEYWDGVDLHPLTPADRKKILDFYQRTSLTANCTAFAYRPLSKTVGQRLAQVYMEVPSESRHLYLPYRSPTPLALSLFEGKWRGVLAQFHSSDSLLGIDGKEEEVNDMEGWFELQCNQVFVGMVTMQYQAQADVVHLVEQLERACIRFVHFSKENELRSRVFSEKMGLESGWNCHISLLSDRNRSDGVPSCIGSKIDIIPSPVTSPSSTGATNLTAALQLDAQHLNERTNLTSSRAMSFSAPSAINMDLLTVKFDEPALNWSEENGPHTVTAAFSHRERRISQDSMIEPINEGEQWRSLSCLTDSTDQSVPFAFDISNRAKLPRGIDKIRPHLELIDNVPLLVSLFTDCNPTVTREMLQIMQDYGEVVCVFGSSANCENVGVFLQADASIAVEPLYPQVCQKLPVFSAPTPQSGPSPVELSRALISLPCAVSMKREDPLSMFQLITCARDFCLALRNFQQFWLCCVVSLSAISVFSTIFMLPLPINTAQVIFISCFLIPILSSSLMVLPTDPQVMHKATGKNQCLINTEALMFVVWCYGLKCLPAVLLNFLWHLASLTLFAQTITSVQFNSTYSVIFPSAVIAPEDSWNGWNQYGYSLFFLQNTCALLFVVHIVTASASYVHRDKLFWHASPFRRAIWIAATLVVLIVEIIFTIFLLTGTTITDSRNELSGLTLPWQLIIAALFSPLVILGINEAVKWQEMKVNKRFQRRKRLDFGTKLGMNSPF